MDSHLKQKDGYTMVDVANETLTEDSIVDIACFSKKGPGGTVTYFYNINMKEEPKTLKDWERVGSSAGAIFNSGLRLSDNLREKVVCLAKEIKHIESSQGNTEMLLKTILSQLLTEANDNFQYPA